VSARIQTEKDNRRQNEQKPTKIKENGSATVYYTQTWVIKNICTFRNLSAAETYLAERQWLNEQLNVVKLRMVRVGTQIPTVSRAERQYLVPVNTFIKKNVSQWRRLICSLCEFHFSVIVSPWYSTSWKNLLWQRVATFLCMRSS
jgi:hypothetical protein